MFTHLNIIHWHKLFYRNKFFFHISAEWYTWRQRVRQNQMENHRKNLPQHFYFSSLHNECYCCYFNEIRCESHTRKKCKRIKKNSSKVLDGGLLRFIILRQRDYGTPGFFVNIFILACFCMCECEFRMRIESLNELKVPRAKYIYTFWWQ